MPSLFLAQITLPPSVQQIVKTAEWSWRHHDTLHYLAFGVGLLLVAWLSASREWNAVFTGLTAVGGFGCLAAAGAIFMLGDTARSTDDAAFDREVAMELRVAHGKAAAYVKLGDPCKSSAECAPGIACVKADDVPRCYERCPADGSACKDGFDCQHSHGARVCVAR